MKKIANSLHKIFIRATTLVIPSSKLRKKFRAKFTIEPYFENNYIFLIDNDGVKRRINHTIKGLQFFIKGANNTIEIQENSMFNNSKVRIIGDNQTLKIGSGFTAHGVVFHLKEDYSSIVVGDDCMFSSNINVWGTDGHAIIKNGENKAYNTPKPVIIGNHVWVGEGVKIAKGTVISDNSIVGMGSVVCGKFNEANVVIAGNPAKIIRREVNWDRRTAYQYNQAQILEA